MDDSGNIRSLSPEKGKSSQGFGEVGQQPVTGETGGGGGEMADFPSVPHPTNSSRVSLGKTTLRLLLLLTWSQFMNIHAQSVPLTVA